jgi:tetratricopeptide (TPR) repeat protein
MVCMPDDGRRQTATAPETTVSETTTYLLNDKPVSAEVYQAASLTNQGIDLDKANRPLEAKQKLIEAIQVAPDYLNAHYNLGVVLMGLKEEAQAEKHFELVVVSGANFPPAWFALAQVRLIRQKYREAVDTFVDALNRYPKKTWNDKPQFYLNYGVALMELGEFDKAIEQMRTALNARADFPELWGSLGSLYQASGRLEDAIFYYKEFIRRFPNSPEAIIVVDSIKALENEIEIAKAHGASAADQRAAKDYYAAITRNGARLWPATKMPLKVHIESGDGVAGFDPRFGEILRTAFDEWSKASEGKVTFRFVDNSDDADIRCSWTSDPSQFKNRGEGGEAKTLYDPTTGTVKTATIAILTVATIGLHKISDNRMRFAALHEVGHALGLIEHSPNPRDIMFFAGWPADIKRGLTERDRQTILRLYASNSWSGSPP